MEPLQNLKVLGEALKGFAALTGVLVAIAQFLFLTVFGWILLAAMIILILISKARNKNGEITFGSFLSGFAELSLWFYANLTSIVISVVIVVFLSLFAQTFREMSESLTLYRDIKMLESALRNLKAERKLIEVTLTPVREDNVRKIRAKVKYFAYSPVRDMDLVSGEAEYIIEGRKFYADFGVMNFDYTLIEKGLAKNVAFPNRIYSDTVAAENGVDILMGGRDVPYTFQLDDKNLYLMNTAEYQSEILKLIGAMTNDATARKMGIRTAYGESIGIIPNTAKTYKFYSTGSGGIVLR